jgi:hypothetical protein
MCLLGTCGISRKGNARFPFLDAKEALYIFSGKEIYASFFVYTFEGGNLAQLFDKIGET